VLLVANDAENQEVSSFMKNNVGNLSV